MSGCSSLIGWSNIASNSFYYEANWVNGEENPQPILVGTTG